MRYPLVYTVDSLDGSVWNFNKITKYNGHLKAAKGYNR